MKIELNLNKCLGTSLLQTFMFHLSTHKLIT